MLYINRFAAAPARRLAFFGNHDALWTVACDAADAGVDIPALIDTRAQVSPGLIDEARRRRLRIVLGGEIFATYGKTLRAFDLRASGAIERIEADGVAMSSGFSPNVHLT